MKKILIVFGTRPEAIKMAPVVKELKNRKERWTVEVCLSGQHRQMLDQVMDFFEIEADYDLNVMKPNQSLTELSANILLGMKGVLEKSAAPVFSASKFASAKESPRASKESVMFFSLISCKRATT